MEKQLICLLSKKGEKLTKLCNKNLRMLLARSIGDSLRAWVRQYFVIVTCCTIDWFTPWPNTTLLDVTEHIFMTVDKMELS